MTEQDSPPSQCTPVSPVAPSVVATPDSDSPPPQCAPVSSPVVPSVVAAPDPGASSSPPLASLLRRTQGGPMGLRNPTKSSCYLNSVLQCLTFTPPLAEYCLRKVHSTNCKDWRCTLCILEKRIWKSLEAPQNADTPRDLSMHVITQSELFQQGRHEDAHELLSFLIDDCGKAFEDPLGNGKSVLNKLFGGVLQSHVECRQCNAASTRNEDMLDLSLNICELGTLAEALACFFRPEVLDGDNKYHCQGCDSLSVARKRMSIHDMPKVLTIQLKRFDPLSGKKLGHFIQFEEQLNVTNYISKKFTEGPVPYYKLYAVIEHVGNSRDSGHYVAAVKETNGAWYYCDDDNVQEFTEEDILQATAYLLFYIRSDVTRNECV